MTDQEEYERTIPNPVPLPDFYDTDSCWWCHKHFGFYRHHIRRNQNRVPVVVCPHCEKCTRVKLSYADNKLGMGWLLTIRTDLTTGKLL